MPMLLKSLDGKEFELAVIQDRLPESHDGYGDDETPTVSFRVATDDVEWEETAPHLGMHELRNLQAWLESVVEGSPSEAEIDILENELNFKVLKDHGKEVHIRVAFHLEDRPEEFAIDAGTPEARHVDLKLPREVLASAVAQLKTDIEAAAATMKDDIDGSEDLGNVRPGDGDGGFIDRVDDEPAGAGTGEDNAGER